MSDISYGAAEHCSVCNSFDINRTELAAGQEKVKVRASCQGCGVFWFEHLLAVRSTPKIIKNNLIDISLKHSAKAV
jgi:hypothetical protein